MSLIANVKQYFFQRRLLKEIEQRQVNYQSRAVNPATAKCVAVLFVADDPQHRKVVESYRQKRKKEGLRTELLGFFVTPINDAGVNFDHFTSKDLNWYGVPGGNYVDKFLARSCDLLITLGPAGHPQLDYLASIKDTNLRVGPYTESFDNPYDVLYNTKNKTTEPHEQLNQIEKIFKVTNAAAIAVI
ncbi:MAG: hypothetical protein AAF828_04915 [Bacteroidota bacterium]